MTAFNSIKTNNWPAASNDLEDFLVLELPLNDQAALTSFRRDIVAGSTVLHPKRTLTNNGVIMASPDISYSSLISGSVDGTYPLSNCFGGTIGSGYTNGTRSTVPGTLTLDLSSLNITVTNVRLNTYIYGTPSTFQVNGTNVGGSWGTADQTHVISVNGQLNTIAWAYDSTIGPYCYMRGIEVDYGDGNGYQLLTDGPNGPKKHYDKNADFSGGKYLGTTVSSPGLAFGNGDFTIEYWAYYDDISAGNSQVGDFQTSTTSGGLMSSYSTGVHTNFYPSGTLNFSIGNSNAGTITNIATGTWYHMAFVRESGSVRLYKDGVLQATTTSNTSAIGTYIAVGGYYSTSYCRNGLLQDFRVYKGLAKYTANFTPPGAILG